MTEVFQKKAQASCNGIAQEQMEGCMEVASDRLFCAMFSRHFDKFKSYEGASQYAQHCKEIDPMETVKDATKDAIEEKEAQQA